MAVSCWRQIDRQGDEPGKPEDHGDSVYGQNTDLVPKVWKVNRRKGKIGSGNESGPNAIEEHEIDRRASMHITHHYTGLTNKQHDYIRWA